MVYHKNGDLDQVYHGFIIGFSTLSNIIQYYPIFPEKHLRWIKTSNATLRKSPAMLRSLTERVSFVFRFVVFICLYLKLCGWGNLGNNIQIY